MAPGGTTESAAETVATGSSAPRVAEQDAAMDAFTVKLVQMLADQPDQASSEV